MARRTHEEAMETRKDILEAALELFSRQGYDKTNLADIARKANVTRGAIYWYFSNKREIFETIESEFESQIFQYINEYIQTFDTASDKILSLVEYFSFNTEKLEKLKKLHEMEFLSGSAMRELIEEKGNRILNRALDLYRDIVKEGVDSGEFRIKASRVEFISTFLASLYIGAAFIRLSAPDRFRNYDYRLIISLILEKLKTETDPEIEMFFINNHIHSPDSSSRK